MSSVLRKDEYDPVYLHSRRESLLILAVWACCMVWTVSYCYLNGYGVKPEDVELVWGIPSWVFWGIAVPWLLADVFAVFFCFFFMVEDDLGASPEELADQAAGEAKDSAAPSQKGGTAS